MSVDTTIREILEPYLSGGCHNRVNRDSPVVAPYAVFHEISGIPINTIHPVQSGVARCRYQIDVFARTPEQAKGLALGSLKTALEDNSMTQATLIFQASGQYSDLDKTYQYITEYTIWTT